MGYCARYRTPPHSASAQICMFSMSVSGYKRSCEIAQNNWISHWFINYFPTSYIGQAMFLKLLRSARSD